MGARNSKRSVDITTTPKKGDECAVLEDGEGKLEKIAEPDLKVTTNGTLHNDIEFADKEETSKDETEDREKDVESSKSEMKENGLPGEPSNAVIESKKSEEAVENVPEQQVNGDSEKAFAKEKADQQLEEATEQKKKKEKKKKWSFRSISFSKKDKSKPSKESMDKNGEVKEVAEENLDDKSAPPVEEKVKLDEVQPTESIESAAVATNGKATSEQTEKPAAAETKEEAPKAVEEASEPEEIQAEEKKEAEPVLAAAPEPVAAVTEATPEIEESSKEVRTEEVPPPLPSSNPPSPVTVFAESTKAEAALTSGQVPLEVQETVVSSVVVPVNTEPPKTEDLEVLEIPAVETVADPSPPNLQDSVLEPLPPSPPSPVPEKMESLVPQSGQTETIESPKSLETKEIPDPSPSIEDLPPAPPSPIPDKLIDLKSESAPTIIDSEPVSGSTPNTDESSPAVDLEPTPVVDPEPLPVIDPEPLPVIDPEPLPVVDPEPLPVVDPEPLPIIESSPAVEPERVSVVESSPVVNPESVSIVESSPVVDPEAVPIIESSPVVEPEHIPIVETAPVVNVKPESVGDSLTVEPPLPEEPELPSEIAPAEATNAEVEPTQIQLEELKTKLESETKPSVEPVSVGHVEPSTPPSTPAANYEIPAAELAMQSEIPASPPLDISEPVVATADSLPDISTESLPSLPELLSESLAPMSLPPVDSVPEPIAPSSEPTSQEEQLVSPPIAPLTNGNMNGHSSPSPVEEEKPVLETEVPGPTKQVASDQAKESEITPEADDNPRETAPAVVPAVEE